MAWSSEQFFLQTKTINCSKGRNIENKFLAFSGLSSAREMVERQPYPQWKKKRENRSKCDQAFGIQSIVWRAFITAGAKRNSNNKLRANRTNSSRQFAPGAYSLSMKPIFKYRKMQLFQCAELRAVTEQHTRRFVALSITLDAAYEAAQFRLEYGSAQRR